ncbi:MAG: T9SS type A sorting domain-containing protein [Bacteroidota bacterium]|nr:T9SS type A sorting domain-containing protein [Bacteroidota bacterium]
MKKIFSILLLYVLLIVLPSNAILAQISFGGKPLIESITLPNPPVVEFPAPDLKQIKLEDDESAIKQQPYRIAVAINSNYDFIQAAQKTKVANGYVWRLILHSTGAKALSVTFSQFVIPAQGKLFMYDPGLTKKIGAFTSENNKENDESAFEMIPGESAVLEYFQPFGVTTQPQLIISELLYIYRSPGYTPSSMLKNFGEAETCEVNVNCPEGKPYSDQKQGVVRIFIRAGMNAYWCSGSLVNNTKRDFKPYILSAAHCLEGATLTDLNKWVFYFNYEAIGCSNPTAEPSSKTMSGASLISVSGTSANGQSDFLLLQLDQPIPLDYNAWYFGWSRETTSNPGAIGIHHPAGDIKKISFVLNSPVAVNVFGGTPSTNGTHWQVNWHSTASGFGVTEPGSSGSPLINAEGNIIGTLSGGGSDCTSTGAADYYGKVSAHWTSDGTSVYSQLGPWLDPQSSGVNSMTGSYNNDNVIAKFTSDGVVIPPDNTVTFTDKSIGNMSQWSWTFPGGEPSTSSDENPQSIRYLKTGSYDVQLIVANDFKKDTLLLKNYIQVKYQVYPNPTRGTTELFISKDALSQFDVIVNNVEGMQIKRFTAFNTNKVTLDFTSQRSGIYFVTIVTPGNTQTYKVVVTR